MTDPSKAQACATATPAADCGSGFIMANLMVQSLDASPPTVSGALSPGAPNGPNGWVHLRVAGRSPTRQTVVSSSEPRPIPGGHGRGSADPHLHGQEIGGTNAASVTFKLGPDRAHRDTEYGIKKKYRHGKKPKKNKVSCTATDAVSGVTRASSAGSARRRASTR